MKFSFFKSGRPRKRRGLSPLTQRVLAVNITSLLILGFGVLYAGQYEQQLIRTELEGLNAKGNLFAAAIAEGGVREKINDTGDLAADLSIPMVRRLAETTNVRIRLFGKDGKLLADSHQLIGPGGMVEIIPLDPPLSILNPAERLRAEMDRMLRFLPTQNSLPVFPPLYRNEAQAYPDGIETLSGTSHLRSWRNNHNEVMLTAFVPVQRLKQVLGAVLLTQDGTSIANAVAEVRFGVLRIFLLSLTVTILLSVYLSGTITRPIRRLALGAEALEKGRGRVEVIPDFSKRKDEIGELSRALRAMTRALWDRLDAIENFAADVAHEIKNPLASLRSAVETLARVKTDAQRERMLGIIQDDVIRMDRLISDISTASRLDAEISREVLEVVDIPQMLSRVIETFQERLAQDYVGRMQAMPKIVFENAPTGKSFKVWGSESQLVRVVENLLANAASFSPDSAQVLLHLEATEEKLIFFVQNEGPPIPVPKLETIFERFYTERPDPEKFGRHSGLGLSICQQIVRAHHGEVQAENVKDDAGRPIAVRFRVVLPRLNK